MQLSQNIDTHYYLKAIIRKKAIAIASSGQFGASFVKTPTPVATTFNTKIQQSSGDVAPKDGDIQIPNLVGIAEQYGQCYTHYYAIFLRQALSLSLSLSLSL